jgi:hypothetical protein
MQIQLDYLTADSDLDFEYWQTGFKVGNLFSGKHVIHVAVYTDWFPHEYFTRRPRARSLLKSTFQLGILAGCLPTAAIPKYRNA